MLWKVRNTYILWPTSFGTKVRTIVATIYLPFGTIVTLVANIYRSIRTIVKISCIGDRNDHYRRNPDLGMVATKVTLVKIFCDGGF